MTKLEIDSTKKLLERRNVFLLAFFSKRSLKKYHKNKEKNKFLVKIMY